MSTLNNSSMVNYTYCVGGGRHVNWISVTMGTLMPLCTWTQYTCVVLLHVNKAMRLYNNNEKVPSHFTLNQELK